MSSCRWSVFVIVVLLSVAAGGPGAVVDGAPIDGSNKLLLVLIDGFRWNYFNKFDENELLGFNKLRRNGIAAESFVPAFPTLSYVNYYSIMTGEE